MIPAALAAATRTAIAATITARAAVTATRAAAVATAITTITARFTRLARRAGVFQLGTGFLIDDAHGQANLAAGIDLEDLDLNGLAFLDHIGGLLDALVAPKSTIFTTLPS